MKKKILLSIIFLIIVFFFGVFFITPLTLNKQDGFYYHLKSFVPESLKIFIKKNFIQSTLLKNKNIYLKESLDKIHNDYFVMRVSHQLDTILNSEIISKKKNIYSLTKIILPFDAQPAWKGKPSGYIEEYEDNLIISSGKGEFISIKFKDLNLNKLNFNLIKTNLTELIGFREFYMPGNYGIRDLKVIGEKIYVSYPKEIKPDCYNVSIIVADINLKNLNFEEFFNFDKCLGAWGSTRSGGRIENYKENILFSVGDYGLEAVQTTSQDTSHPFGKILLIDKDTKNYKLVSYGHRNAQGLFYDEENDVVIETEHGPDGGDEVNKIIVENDLKSNNYGWPISSYGFHYEATLERHKKEKTLDMLKKWAPLHKSHKDYGFNEPLKNWTPSIGVSQITKINSSFYVKAENDFFVAALGNNIPEGDMTIHHLSFNKNFNKIEFEDKIVIGERIRDIYFSKKNNLILMILENSPALGILKPL